MGIKRLKKTKKTEKNNYVIDCSLKNALLQAVLKEVEKTKQ